MVGRTDVNGVRSREIAAQLCLVKKQCYQNAVIALLSLSELQAEGFYYIEGHVVDFLAMPHGWLANEREILDPTLALSPRPAHPTQYFAAVVYSWQEVEKLSTRVATPFVDRDGHGGQSMAAYREAEQIAMITMLRLYARVDKGS